MGDDLGNIRISGVLDAGNGFGFEGLPFFEKLGDAFGVDAGATGDALDIAGLATGGGAEPLALIAGEFGGIRLAARAPLGGFFLGGFFSAPVSERALLSSPAFSACAALLSFLLS